jgi:hypothetical protein
MKPIVKDHRMNRRSISPVSNVLPAPFAIP